MRVTYIFLPLRGLNRFVSSKYFKGKQKEKISLKISLRNLVLFTCWEFLLFAPLS